MKKLTIADGKVKWPGMEISDVYSHVAGYNQAIDEMNAEKQPGNPDMWKTILSMQQETDSLNTRITELESTAVRYEVQVVEEAPNSSTLKITHHKLNG